MSKLSDWAMETFRPKEYARRQELDAVVSSVDAAMAEVIRRIDSGESLEKIIPRYIDDSEPKLWWYKSKQSWAFSEVYGSFYKMPVGKEIIFESGRGGMKHDLATIKEVDHDETHLIYLLEFTTAEAPS